MKINWGYKILIVYLAFVAGILFLVFKASGEKYDMVTENYYEQELKYQEVIDQKERVSKLSSLPVINHTSGQLTIEFPAELNGKELKGQCYLYRPSDETKDIRQDFHIRNGRYEMLLPAQAYGMYDLKLSWEMEGRQYFYEKKIFL